MGFLSHSDFERLKANPYQEHEAITAAKELMYEDKNAYEQSIATSKRLYELADCAVKVQTQE